MYVEIHEIGFNFLSGGGPKDHPPFFKKNVFISFQTKVTPLPTWDYSLATTVGFPGITAFPVYINTFCKSTVHVPSTFNEIIKALDHFSELSPSPSSLQIFKHEN